jgi:hypothetical protein
VAEDLQDGGIEPEDRGGLVELLERGAEKTSFNTDNRHGWLVPGSIRRGLSGPVLSA